jgi:hypothetical protein
MTFNEAKAILDTLQAKYATNPSALSVALDTMRVVAPEFKWYAFDDCGAVVQSANEAERYKVSPPVKEVDGGELE